MGFLTAVEQQIDALVRRVFPRRPGEGVQPVEIAKEMAKAMESRRTLSVDAVYVPNVFRAAVHPADYAALLPVMNTVKRDSVSYVERVAGKRGLSFTGPVRLEIVPDEALAPGRVTVSAGFEEATREWTDRQAADDRTVVGRAARAPRPERSASPGGEPPAQPDAATREYEAVNASAARRPETAEKESGAAWLEVASGPDAGRRLLLDAGRTYVIGRLEGADLVLSDTRVSKRHAEVRYQGGAWWLVDLDSTNGTRKNGRSIVKEPLADGDLVAVGLTTLRFRGGPSKSRAGLERA